MWPLASFFKIFGLVYDEIGENEILAGKFNVKSQRGALRNIGPANLS